MPDSNLKLLNEDLKFKVGFFECVIREFVYTKFDGSQSEPQKHFVFKRGDSVAALIHLKKSDEIVLVEQVRIATIGHTNGWMLELPAGKIDANETPEHAAQREVFEEVGIECLSGEPIGAFFPSPGACSEFIHLFYIPIEESIELEAHGGLAIEHEDIKTHRIQVKEFLRMAKDQELLDGKTLTAALWLQNRLG